MKSILHFKLENDAVEVSPTGVELIKRERVRQVTWEGYDAAHDDRYTSGELIMAACAYALASCPDAEVAAQALTMWPAKWSFLYFQPTTRIRNLVKAGALIAAEIDRLQRAGEK